MEELAIEFSTAVHDDLARVQAFLKPYMNGQHLLPRTSIELELLLKHAFLAEHAGDIIGFSAVEIYSRKLAEIQCLAVNENYQRRGIGRSLVALCIQRAKEQGVAEVMAISSSDELFRSCGFDYSLPNQKRALFVQPCSSDYPDSDDPNTKK